MIVLTNMQRMILLDRLETMMESEDAPTSVRTVEGMVNIGTIDPHRMTQEQRQTLCESINTNDFYEQLEDVGANPQQLQACKRTMETLCTLLSMYKVYATFHTTKEVQLR